MFLRQFTLILYNFLLAICCCVKDNIISTKFVRILMYPNQGRYTVPLTCFVCWQNIQFKGSFSHSLRWDEVEFLLRERIFELVGKKVFLTSEFIFCRSLFNVSNGRHFRWYLLGYQILPDFCLSQLQLRTFLSLLHLIVFHDARFFNSTKYSSVTCSKCIIHLSILFNLTVTFTKSRKTIKIVVTLIQYKWWFERVSIELSVFWMQIKLLRKDYYQYLPWASKKHNSQ